MFRVRPVLEFWRSFRSAQDGAVALVFALSLIAIMTLVGLALDYSRAMNAKSTLAAAADAAALATARDPDVNPGNLQQRAEDFFLANIQNSAFGTNFTIVATELPGGEGVHVDITAKVTTTLMSLVGVDFFSVAAKSEAIYNTNKVELVLVLDNTGSMSRNGKIETLRTASDDMIDLLLPDGAPPDNVKIGIVPFDLGVKVGTQYVGANWLRFDSDPNAPAWDGCVGPRQPTRDVDDSTATGANKIPAIYDDQTSCNLARVLPLTGNKATLHNKIAGMQPVGWTYIPEGLAWGWRVLSPSLPYNEGVAYADPDWVKIMVLMTDGANTVRWSWPGGEPDAQVRASSSTGNAKTATLCQNIKDQGIIVYTVAFQVSSNTTQSMMEDCASSPNHYFDAQDNASLESAFARIGGDINNLRLSK